MRVAAREISEGRKGQHFWAHEARAKELTGKGQAEFTNLGDLKPDAGILRRTAAWPENRFSYVSPDWAGQRVVIIGGGPSLIKAQVDMARASGSRIIAVNDAYLLAPDADICYFADSEWWRWHTEGLARPGLNASQVAERFRDFKGQKCSIQSSGMNVTDPNVHLLRNAGTNGVITDASAIRDGRHGGVHAVNIATLSGSKLHILIGFDARDPQGKPTHWFGDHPKREPTVSFQMYRQNFTAIENLLKSAGVRVINASPNSAIESFQKLPLDEALQLNV
jgi:hypothetical protein